MTADYRVFLQPLANSAGDYQPAMEITRDILSRLTISQRLNKNRWSVGLLYPSIDSIELDNADGRYATPDNPLSVFTLSGADRARVRVEDTRATSSGRVIYRGHITTRGSAARPGTGKALWRTRTPDITFNERSFNPGLIVAGMTIREALTAAFTDLGIAAAFPGGLNLDNFYDPNPGGTFIADEQALLGEDRNAADVLEKLLLACDCIMTYVPYSQQARVMRRAEPPSYRADGTFAVGWSSGYISDPIQIHDIDTGVEQVFNQVIAKTGRSGSNAVLVEEHAGSMSRWGRRTLEIDLSWNIDLAQIQRLAKNLLARLHVPLQVVELTATMGERNGLLDLYHGDAIVGGLVGVHIPARSPRGSPRAGTARIGDDGTRPQPTTYPAIEGLFYIEEIKRNIRDDTAWLRLRRYIETE